MITSPHPVLALGAWLKNTACLLDADGVHSSPLHGDLRDAQSCLALEESARHLGAQAGPVGLYIAHDLHPDFFSTRLAQTLAAEWQATAVGVQHHHAHIAAVMAEHGLDESVIGLALDGVGLGTDGSAWGGELLWVQPGSWKRLAHLWPLALPGGDAAAHEPWRMLASALHAMARGSEIPTHLEQVQGTLAARTIQHMLERGLNCPTTTSTGRWFDAAAAALGLCLQRQEEAEAAIELERQATQWLISHDPAGVADDHMALLLPNGPDHTLDLRPLVARLLAWPAAPNRVPAAAAWFHLMLARALADWAAHAARQARCTTVCLGGGCFMNKILTEHVTRQLQAQGLRVYRPQARACGDAGLALGQAWVVAQQRRYPVSETSESLSCV
ncbi:carbamoyltransferase HypF [Hydrogenophaga sp.]|uniref:Kae1-like domain-containing protein n=1 Tax=Hydrogenophaga sp. TaxID=1904254 RepID=UPI003562CAE1